MIKDYVKFLLVKLLLVAFAAFGSGLSALLFSFTVGERTDPTFAFIITNALPSFIFFAFIFSFAAKIKKRDIKPDARYCALFAAREASVYAIFMIPVSIAAALSKSTVVQALLAPHMILRSLGCGIIVNYAGVVLLYAALSLTAHITGKNRAAGPDAAASDDGDNDNDEERQEETDNDTENG